MSFALIDYRGSHLGTGRGELYDSRYSTGRTNWLWEGIEKPFLQNLLLKASKTNQGKFLDFATGTGRIAGLAVPFFPDITGIDVSPDMLSRAEEKYPQIRFILTDVTRENPALGPFEVIFVYRFFLNAQLELQAKVLRWIRKVISPTGIFILNNHLSSLSINGLMARFFNLISRTERRAALSTVRLNLLLKHHGFQTQKIFGFGFLPGSHNFSILPQSALVPLERFMSRLSVLYQFSENQIFLCRSD